MEKKKSDITPFTSTDGLAGDPSQLRGSIKAREDTIYSLEAKIAELEHACEDEERALDAALRSTRKEIRRQMVESLEHKLEAVEQKKIEDRNDMKIRYEARKASLREQIAKLLALNQREKKLIAPIRKLPAELLGYVFQYYVEQDHSPWLLATVSRRWLHTAVATPVLWTHLRLGIGWESRYSYYHNFWNVDGKTRLSCGRRIICQNVAELQLISNRAGSLCLDIQIGSGSYQASFLMIQVALQGASMANRIAGLSISLDEDPATVQMQYEKLELAPLPNLQSLKLLQLSAAFGAHLLDQVSSSSPQMAYLKVTQKLPLSPNYSFWPTLELLDLGDGRSYSYDDVLEPSALDKLIPTLQRLKILQNPPRYWPHGATPREATLSNLTRLNVRCQTKYLEKLNLPSLTHLSIDELELQTYQQRLPGPSAICFPSLTTLEVTHVNPGNWLHVLSAPVMSSIVLRGLAPRKTLSIPKGIAFPSVTRVVLAEWFISADNVITALEWVPNAKEVTLEIHPDAKGWALSILEKLAKAAGDGICPLMTSLTLGSNHLGIMGSKGTVKSLAKKVVKRRSESGVVIDHFQASFSYGCVTIQYA